MTTKSERRWSEGPECIETTLLELVNAVAEVARNDEEVVAVIHHLMERGAVRLLGHFTEADFGVAA